MAYKYEHWYLSVLFAACRSLWQMCVHPSRGEQEWHEHCTELYLLSCSSHQEESSGYNAYCEYSFFRNCKDGRW